ncbi:hypothetical protein HU200_035059 [Digitaria exilis]|uniref:aldehyde oxygenase (deformylating) n=1 Tax=Digitaria exilis TaxID=1010633 RepID=A0A835BUM3_9POAL|nr:hypothetical protein HU200_035059 [Digitaria exilis]
MIPYATAAEAEAALGRAMTWTEAVWFQYSATTPDYCLYYHTALILLVSYTLAPLPLALLELRATQTSPPAYKLQPAVRRTVADFLRCYRDAVSVLVLTVGGLQLVSFRIIKKVGIRTGLPLPSVVETVAQLVVYFLAEDYLTYWFHRLLHTPWGYEKIHRVHHEHAAPMGFAAAYAHWVELIIFAFPAFAGPAIVPCHMTTFWLWFILGAIEAVDTHSGFNFPFNPARLIPFYGGAEYHDYHHYVGRQSQSNFGLVFTFCDYIYGTDKGYKYHKASLAKVT